MAVEIKELMIKMSLQDDSSKRESVQNYNDLKRELKSFCARLVSEQMEKQKER